jgi:hypothetical protein
MTKDTFKLRIPYESRIVGRMPRSRTPSTYFLRESVEVEIPRLAGKDMDGKVKSGFVGDRNQGEWGTPSSYWLHEGRMMLPTRFADRSIKHIAFQEHRKLGVGAAYDILMSRLPSDTEHFFSTPYFRLLETGQPDKPGALHTKGLIDSMDGFAEVVADDRVERRAEAVHLGSMAMVVDGTILTSSWELGIRTNRDIMSGRIDGSLEAIDVLELPSRLAAGSGLLVRPDDASAPSYVYTEGPRYWEQSKLVSRIDYDKIADCRVLARMIGVFLPDRHTHAFHGSGTILVPDVTEEADLAVLAASAAIAQLDDPSRSRPECVAACLEAADAFTTASSTCGHMGRREDWVFDFDATLAAVDRWQSELASVLMPGEDASDDPDLMTFTM